MLYRLLDHLDVHFESTHKHSLVYLFCAVCSHFLSECGSLSSQLHHSHLHVVEGANQEPLKYTCVPQILDFDSEVHQSGPVNVFYCMWPLMKKFGHLYLGRSISIV